jgi:ATP-dependent DNA helicase RecG
LNIESLRKILELEREKGYHDSAVIGGLDKFLHRWSGQAIESITSQKLLAEFRRLRLDDSRYAEMTSPHRQRWIEEILAFIPQLGEIPVEKAEPKPPKSVSPPRKRPSAPKIAKIATGSLDEAITTIKGVSTAMAAKF